MLGLDLVRESLGQCSFLGSRQPFRVAYRTWELQSEILLRASLTLCVRPGRHSKLLRDHHGLRVLRLGHLNAPVRPESRRYSGRVGLIGAKVDVYAARGLVGRILGSSYQDAGIRSAPLPQTTGRNLQLHKDLLHMETANPVRISIS